MGDFQVFIQSDKLGGTRNQDRRIERKSWMKTGPKKLRPGTASDTQRDVHAHQLREMSLAVAPNRFRAKRKTKDDRPAALMRAWVRIDSNGESSIVHTDKLTLTQQLGIQPRDLRLLEYQVVNQTSVILTRERAIVINMAFVKAIITLDACYIVSPDDERSIQFMGELQRRVKEPVAASKAASKLAGQADAAAALGPVYLHELPFELRVLEICLDELASDLDLRATQLEASAYPAVDAMAKLASRPNLDRVRRIKHTLSQLSKTTETFLEALEELLDNDHDMWELNLGAKVAKHEADDMIAGGSLTEPQHMQLAPVAEDEVLLTQEKGFANFQSHAAAAAEPHHDDAHDVHQPSNDPLAITHPAHAEVGAAAVDASSADTVAVSAENTGGGAAQQLETRVSWLADARPSDPNVTPALPLMPPLRTRVVSSASPEQPHDAHFRAQVSPFSASCNQCFEDDPRTVDGTLAVAPPPTSAGGSLGGLVLHGTPHVEVGGGVGGRVSFEGLTDGSMKASPVTTRTSIHAPLEKPLGTTSQNAALARLSRRSLALLSARHGSSLASSSALSSVYNLEVSEVEMLLDLYFMHVNSTMRRLKTLGEYVEDTEEMVYSSLNAKRNRLIAYDLLFIGINCISMTVTGMTGLFTMNLYHSDYDSYMYTSNTFLEIALASMGAYLLFGGLLGYYMHTGVVQFT